MQSKKISILNLIFKVHSAILFLIWCIQPLSAHAITSDEMGIIIIDGNALSEQIGAYYQLKRGIPDTNIVRITLPEGYGIGTDTIPADKFTEVKTQVDLGLPSNVQATLLTWLKPYSVGQEGSCLMSITSAFAFGYDSTFCSSAINSEYFDSDSSSPWSDYGIRPSMMLGASNWEYAKRLIDRGVSSDATYPTGDGYLIKTTNFIRSLVRDSDFLSLPTLWDFPGGLKLYYLDRSTGPEPDYLVSQYNILFYFTGNQKISAIDTNHYLPGAIADHLTSWAGVLSGKYEEQQMLATDWLKAGATGTYGTVEEPSANSTKFPKASVVVSRYYSGDTLIEAYWKSVLRVGQGLFLGEPLAQPFAGEPSKNGNRITPIINYLLD